MRTANKNKRTLYYALQASKSEKTDTSTITVDGETVYLEEGDYSITYEEPVKFMANISFSGGEATDVEFGVDTSAYDAIIILDDDAIPITETSLIWFENDPDSEEADYSIVAIRKSLNQLKAILKKRVR